MSNLLTNITSHAGAAAAALVLHVGVVAAVMPAMAPATVPQQLIRINMVAPSTEAVPQVKQNVKPAPLLTAAAKLPPTKIQNAKTPDQPAPQPVEQKMPAPVMATTPPTSGLAAPDATEKAAAHTEPVFDAVYLDNPVPVYPQRARRDGVQGKVMLEVDVSAEGRARAVKVAHTSGSSLLDQAAKDAVSRWRFIPAKRGNVAVAATVIVPVAFKLN